MANKEVDKSQLMRYIDIENEIQKLEACNALKNYEVKKKAAEDVGDTIAQVSLTLQQLKLNTKKEKQDVDDMKEQKQPCIKDLFITDKTAFQAKLSQEQVIDGFIKKKEKQDVDNMQQQNIRAMFTDQSSFQAKLTKEQEEYMEALNKEECTRQQLEGLEKQVEQLKAEADKIKEPADKLKKYYHERDDLLCDIFNGQYGSPEENRLEEEFDNLKDQKERISVANQKWSGARTLLQYAVNQLSYAVQRWGALVQLPAANLQLRYMYATETRNNLVAAKQNIESTQKYLSNINFPYCTPSEMSTLEKATNNIYTDMQSPDRHGHAYSCYHVTMRRSAALLQWFDNVIKGTIQCDLMKVTKEAREVEQKLRAERIKLIRQKVEESGGDIKGLNEAGLKGLADQSTEDNTVVDNVPVIKPERVDNKTGDDDTMQQLQVQDNLPPAPTPIPLCDLAPQPSEDELFGNIQQLKLEHDKNLAEYNKAQELNKARMEQGLQEKLNARRKKLY